MEATTGGSVTAMHFKSLKGAMEPL
jgi:hypothetical protein